ncbi:hypothetical protein DB32_005788 [Sandaracinus amylolyticus]|uniref:Uncharacterized protein n=1 Tax=Sandaracinus amylolyticus TaxID=927083 RepID=A0A0F6SGG2_9BACT|nr:hypothetical protein DB32_005788 [Sandaracinus amylolyticus]
MRLALERAAVALALADELCDACTEDEQRELRPWIDRAALALADARQRSSGFAALLYADVAERAAERARIAAELLERGVTSPALEHPPRAEFRSRLDEPRSVQSRSRG